MNTEPNWSVQHLSRPPQPSTIEINERNRHQMNEPQWPFDNTKTVMANDYMAQKHIKEYNDGDLTDRQTTVRLTT